MNCNNKLDYMYCNNKLDYMYCNNKLDDMYFGRGVGECMKFECCQVSRLILLTKTMQCHIFMIFIMCKLLTVPTQLSCCKTKSNSRAPSLKSHPLSTRRGARRVGDRKIYLLTDVGSECNDDGLDQICAGLKEKNVELVVVYVMV